MIPCNGKKEGTIMVFNGKFLVATKNAWLQLDEIQLSGKKRMNANMFLNGSETLKNTHWDNSFAVILIIHKLT